MKKVLVVLFVLLALGTFAFAKQGLALRSSFVYDFVNIKSAESDAPGVDAEIWRANAIGAEFGVSYNFSDKFLIYADSSIGFYNKFKIGDTEITKDYKDNVSFLATAEHIGAAYNIDLGNNMNLQVGGGLAMEYARVTGTTKESDEVSTSGEFGIFAFGVGLYANFDYSFSEKVAVSATVHPDIMFISADHMEASTSTIQDKSVATVTNSLTTFGASASFKFSAAVGVTFKY
ncbi:MAG: hypothetical protein J5599_03055 [Spirochaetales bacterium]|nr:hypothetical protein [Spirochaetales bacterium]